MNKRLLAIPVALALVLALFQHPAPTKAQVVGPAGTITHIIIIDQENRTFNNLFMNFPNANTVTYGLTTRGVQVPLTPVDLCSQGPCNCEPSSGCPTASPYPQGYDPSHKHGAFLTEWNGGRLNGWNQENLSGSDCSDGGVTRLYNDCPADNRKAYTYTPQAEVQPYWTMATQYTLADEMFQTNQGPSFPSHQYIVRGTSVCGGLCLITGPAPTPSSTPGNPNPQYANYWSLNNPDVGSGNGCNASNSSRVDALDQFGTIYQDLLYTCFDTLTLMDELYAASKTWTYYYQTGGVLGSEQLWNGPEVVWHLWKGGANYGTSDVSPPSQVLTDIAGGHLANVVWVTPTGLASDHAKSTDGSGPSWVTSVVNAVGGSSYWNNTAIFVVWDDWGGWFDNVAPPIYNANEWSFRVPLIVISPYARNGYVSHVPHNFGSIFRFVEEAFTLAPLGTDDATGGYSDDLADCFNWLQTPTPYTPIVGALPIKHWIAVEKRDHAEVDY